MNYDAIIKRAQKAIEVAKNKINPVSVHKVTINDSLDKLSGLVIVLHPDYTEPREKSVKRGQL